MEFLGKYFSADWKSDDKLTEKRPDIYTMDWERKTRKLYKNRKEIGLKKTDKEGKVAHRHKKAIRNDK